MVRVGIVHVSVYHVKVRDSPMQPVLHLHFPVMLKVDYVTPPMQLHLLPFGSNIKTGRISPFQYI